MLRTSTGKVEAVDFEDYVKNVIVNEWEVSWNDEALKAGAMGIKAYGMYWSAHHKYPGKDYDVKDTTDDQVYKPGSADPRTNRAVEETWNQVMTQNGALFEPEYDSGRQGSSDPIYTGRMSVWGTQYWAEQGKDWQWILHKYYDPISIQSAGSSNNKVENSNKQAKTANDQEDDSNKEEESSNDQKGDAPVADFKTNIQSGTAPLTVQFTDLSKDVNSWKWDFGDGSTSKVQNPKHRYSKEGSYTVSLTAENDNGKDSTSKTITVKASKTSVPKKHFH